MVVIYVLAFYYFNHYSIYEVFSKKVNRKGATSMNWTFDGNEWFMRLTSLVAFSFVLMIRKHFQTVVFIVIWIYSIAFVETIDYALAGSPCKVYYCADNLTYEPAAALML
jgi:hypothetical protein